MIRLRKYRTGEPWDNTYVWVNPDHITFLSVSVFTPKVGPLQHCTIITAVGGGQTKVRETPEQILAVIT